MSRRKEENVLTKVSSNADGLIVASGITVLVNALNLQKYNHCTLNYYSYMQMISC